MTRLVLLLRLLRCYDSESCTHRRIRLGIAILKLQRNL
jgi:hypothetical protein